MINCTQDGRDALALARKKEYADIVRLLTDSRPQHTTVIMCCILLPMYRYILQCS